MKKEGRTSHRSFALPTAQHCLYLFMYFIAKQAPGYSSPAILFGICTQQTRGKREPNGVEGGEGTNPTAQIRRRLCLQDLETRISDLVLGRAARSVSHRNETRGSVSRVTGNRPASPSTLSIGHTHRTLLLPVQNKFTIIRKSAHHMTRHDIPMALGTTCVE